MFIREQVKGQLDQRISACVPLRQNLAWLRSTQASVAMRSSCSRASVSIASRHGSCSAAIQPGKRSSRARPVDARVLKCG